MATDCYSRNFNVLAPLLLWAERTFNIDPSGGEMQRGEILSSMICDSYCSFFINATTPGITTLLHLVLRPLFRPLTSWCDGRRSLLFLALTVTAVGGGGRGTLFTSPVSIGGDFFTARHLSLSFESPRPFRASRVDPVLSCCNARRGCET